MSCPDEFGYAPPVSLDRRDIYIGSYLDFMEAAWIDSSLGSCYIYSLIDMSQQFTLPDPRVVPDNCENSGYPGFL